MASESPVRLLFDNWFHLSIFVQLEDLVADWLPLPPTWWPTPCSASPSSRARAEQPGPTPLGLSSYPGCPEWFKHTNNIYKLSINSAKLEKHGRLNVEGKLLAQYCNKFLVMKNDKEYRLTDEEDYRNSFAPFEICYRFIMILSRTFASSSNREYLNFIR